MTGWFSKPPSKTMRSAGTGGRSSSSFSGRMPKRRLPAAERVWTKTSSTLPSSAMWPPSRMATRVQIWRMTAISWVMTTTVMPNRSLMSLSRARMDWVVMGSRALVASSHKSTSGSLARARAMATRCFWPPESWAG